VLLVDLTEPRTLHVKGVNTVTGETKDYLLKVTQSGKLLLI
jgi:hemin uptake protein HemP